MDQSVRAQIVDEINGPENVSRKRFEQRKFDIYRNRQAQYVLERLRDEFGPKSVVNMRKVLSINPLPRIIQEQASLYANEPLRHFSNASEQEEETLENLYHYNCVDQQMRLANRYYKLHDQSFLYVVPNGGYIYPRALTPKDLDVIPDANNPEKAYAYILNVWNMDQYSTYISQSNVTEGGSYYNSDRLDQSIADDSDRDKLLERYVVWTADEHFTMDGFGSIIGEVVPNPIGKLPFIDISVEKDFQFFVSRGNQAAEFVIDLLSQLSDLANVSRLQSYAQAVISSVEEPKDVRVGPTKVLWLKLDPNTPDARPTFVFESPSPDLNGGLEIINTQLKMFLSSQGLDASVVSGKDQAKAFSSGVDHLLANLDKFQASKQDMDLFRNVESQLFQLMCDWNNVMQPVSGEGELVPELKGVQISDKVSMEIKYDEPTSVQTQSEKEDSTIKLLDAGLISKQDALMRMFGYDKVRADEELEKISEPSKDLVSAVNDINAGEESTGSTNAGGNAVTDVRKETFNGAQIESIVSLASQVGAGNIPKEAAVNIIAVAFNLDNATAASMLAGELSAKPVESLPRVK
jgi:hypothetical protein